ncbi:MAG: hypothetical protein AAFN77_18105 [Planctomycetota bacterium]
MNNLGFIVFVMGGVGKRAGIQFMKMLRNLGLHEKVVVVYLDTDGGDLNDKEVREYFDIVVDLSLSPGQIETVRENAGCFGPAVEFVVRKYGAQLVNEYEAQAGSRTIRMLTLLSFAYYLPAILDVIHKASCMLMGRGLTRFIKPVMISSSGGGCGSAVQVLLAYCFGQKKLKRQIRYGLPSHIHSPITAVLAEPFTLARLHKPPHRDRILSNSAATTIETESLDAALKPYEVIYHLAFTNSSGVILSSVQDLDRVLGNAILQILICTDVVASRRADTFAIGKQLDRYQGLDSHRFGLEFGMSHEFVDRNLFTRDLDNPFTGEPVADEQKGGDSDEI